MAEYNPSKIVKDGNTYNFRDTTKIPLAGSNAISGSLIPATTDAYDLGGSSYQWNNAYIKSLTINGVACGDILTHNASEFVPRSGGAVMTGTIFAKTADDSYATFCGGNSFDNGASVRVHGKDYPGSPYDGTILIRALNNSNVYDLFLKPDGTAMWGNKNLAMQEDTVPRSGGAVITGAELARNTDTSELRLCGGTTYVNGASVIVYGQDNPIFKGQAMIRPSNSTNTSQMQFYPDGTWTWDGTACQITSDQRLKQQIAEIDDKLLDAWEDVDLVQFKYNDAVSEKGKDNARLHTGYVVQQIDSACKSHGVDISAYGLYCHEEYPQETEEVEVEVEQADGTKTKERKVRREASEHYSLRYTEVYAVECMYLRRCIARLTARIEQLEKRNNTK